MAIRRDMCSVCGGVGGVSINFQSGWKAVKCNGTSAAHLKLHQPLGGEADHLAQDIRIRGLLHKRAKVHHLVGHWGFLGCVEKSNPILPENRQ